MTPAHGESRDYAGGGAPSSVSLTTWETLRRSPTIYVPVVSLTASKTLTQGAGILVGWAFGTSSASISGCRFIDGTSDTGAYMATIIVPASSDNVLFLGEHGPVFSTGLRLNFLTGTMDGGVWVKI
jgi:hypothetical protein